MTTAVEQGRKSQDGLHGAVATTGDDSGWRSKLAWTRPRSASYFFPCLASQCRRRRTARGRMGKLRPLAFWKHECDRATPAGLAGATGEGRGCVRHH
jgi:hypothetical protein